MANIGEYGFNAAWNYDKPEVNKQEFNKQTADVQYTKDISNGSKDLFSYLLHFDANGNGDYSTAEIKAATGLTTDANLAKLWDMDKNGTVNIKEAFNGMLLLDASDEAFDGKFTKLGRTNNQNLLTDPKAYHEMLSTLTQQSKVDEWFAGYLKEIDDAGITEKFTDAYPEGLTPTQKELAQKIRFQILAPKSLIQNPPTDQTEPELPWNMSSPKPNDVQMLDNPETQINEGEYTQKGVQALNQFAQKDISDLETFLDTVAPTFVNKDGLIDETELTVFYISKGDNLAVAQTRAKQFLDAFDQDKNGKINKNEHMANLALEDNPDLIKSDKARVGINKRNTQHDAALNDLLTEEHYDADGNKIDFDTNNDGKITPKDFLPTDLRPNSAPDNKNDGNVDISDIPSRDDRAFIRDGISTNESRLFVDLALQDADSNIKEVAKSTYNQLINTLGQ